MSVDILWDGLRQEVAQMLQLCNTSQRSCDTLSHLILLAEGVKQRATQLQITISHLPSTGFQQISQPSCFTQTHEVPTDVVFPPTRMTPFFPPTIADDADIVGSSYSNHRNSKMVPNPHFSVPLVTEKITKVKVHSPLGTQSRVSTSIEKKRSKRKFSGTRECHICGQSQTPEWRKGPRGSHTLCNACGLNYAKKMKNEAATLLRNGTPEENIQTILLSRTEEIVDRVRVERRGKLNEISKDDPNLNIDFSCPTK